ncbi:Gramicidin S synthase 2 [compost metagenome]
MLFDTMLVLQNTEEATMEIPGLTLQPYKRNKVEAKFDLTLYVTPEQNQLTCNFEFATKLFDHTTISTLIEDLKILLFYISSLSEYSLKNMELTSKRGSKNNSIMEVELEF